METVTIQGPGNLDFTRAMMALRTLFSASIKDCFFASRAPDGTPWPPLKRPRSRPRDRRRRRVGGEDKPLLDTGLLRASTAAVGEALGGQVNAEGRARMKILGGAGHLEEITPVSIKYGTTIYYGKFHQHGTRTVPQRKFVGWTPQLIERAKQIVLAEAVRQLRGGR